MSKSMPPLKLSDRGAPPVDLPPDLPVTDEGPMRGELRRQIARLERELAHFAADNLPHEAISTSPQRGPSMLTTADLERIRDELLETRARLHQTVVERATREPVVHRSPVLEFLKRLLARVR